MLGTLNIIFAGADDAPVIKLTIRSIDTLYGATRKKNTHIVEASASDHPQVHAISHAVTDIHDDPQPSPNKAYPGHRRRSSSGTSKNETNSQPITPLHNIERRNSHDDKKGPIRGSSQPNLHINKYNTVSNKNHVYHNERRRSNSDAQLSPRENVAVSAALHKKINSKDFRSSQLNNNEHNADASVDRDRTLSSGAKKTLLKIHTKAKAVVEAKKIQEKLEQLELNNSPKLNGMNGSALSSTTPTLNLPDRHTQSASEAFDRVIG